MYDYEKMNETEKLNFLAELSNMYYELNMTQSEIANKFSTSRFKISKLLQEARNQNVVEITINKPHTRINKLENLLKDNFDLKHVIVLDNKSLPLEETLSSLAKLGAEYLDSIITENSIIGVLWGKTISNVVKRLKPKNKLPITVVQVMGAAAKDDPSIDSPELIRKFANSYGGKYKYLYAPLYIDNDYARKALMQEPVINDTLFLANKADIILTGIGTVDAAFASTLWSKYVFSEQHNNNSLTSKAVGCAFARLYDNSGQEAVIDVNSKIVGIDLDTIRATNYVIGVAAGKFKAEAILGALRGKYINVLITDDDTASKVLSLAQINSNN
ncbi:sugar-binding transcriptional regulator [Clostridium sp. SHJSY1]|uniref:sugar-binding transcriptional regulator n=1 Tax=Clostridium sp. SHJSY1 TaxID=2942483 RepID=UPI002874CD59|nr:sugar-binding transcriptional regulator [Clostridium sp. SHJSY1]MDS0526489.1 sugar-binding transcriptional regulator [Clostridium sp. SHJSY1]